MNGTQTRSGWETRPLRDVVTKLVDGSHNPPAKQTSGLPMLSARNIENGRIVFDEYRFISKEAFSRENSRTRVAEGDVLLTIVGSIGRAAVFPSGVEPFALQRSVAVMTPIGVLPKFLMYQFQSPSTQRHFKTNARGTAQRGIYLRTLADTPVQVAPLAEQKCIVAEIEKQFSRLDDAVANLKRVKADLKRYRAAVLKAAVEGRLVPTEAELARREGRTYETGKQLLARILVERRAIWEKGTPSGRKQKYVEPQPPDISNVPELPEGWKWATAEQLTDETRAITYGVIKLGPTVSGGVPVLRSSDVRHLALDLKNVKRISSGIAGQFKRTFLRGGEVLVTVRGTLGGVACVPNECSGFNISREVAMLALVDHTIAGVVAIFIGSAPLQRWLLLRTKGIAYTGINIETLKNFPIPVPPLAEQRRIVVEVERRLSMADEIETQVDAGLQRAGRLRQAILKRAFEGTLD